MDWVETAVMRNAGLRGEMLMFSSSAAAAGHCQHPLLYLQSPLSSSSAEEAASVDRSGACENFSVDDLLDLGGGKEQNGGEDDFLRAAEAEDEEEEEEDEEEKEGKESSTGFNACSSSDLSFQALPPSSDPIVPAGDLADLEWVSRFVDDSYSEFPSAVAPGLLQSHHAPTPAPVDVAAKAEAPEHQSTSSGITSKRTWGSCCCFSTDSLVVPAKARSKRSRTVGRVWSLGLPHLLAESSTSSCSSSASCSAASSSMSSCLLYERLGSGSGGGPQSFLDVLGGENAVSFQPALVQQLVKKKKKKGRKPKAALTMGASAAAVGSRGCGEPQTRRRCSHCGVDKTPQWRAGPMGAKTLCNACGVRYKSGRLLPEYRPAGSPTFLSHVHSNSHRKVLEMRRKNEVFAGAASPPTASYSLLPPSPPLVVASQPYGVV